MTDLRRAAAVKAAVQSMVLGLLEKTLNEYEAAAILAKVANVDGPTSSGGGCPPEARLLAEAKPGAIFNQASNSRGARPDIDMVMVRALTAGIDEGSHWRSPTHYSTICDHPAPGAPCAEKRQVPLSKDQLMLRD